MNCAVNHQRRRAGNIHATGSATFTPQGALASNGFGAHSPGQYTLLACALTEIVMTFMFLMMLAGAGVVGFFGKRLGDLVIVLATALAGATLVVYGLARVFSTNIGNGSVDPTKILSSVFALLLWAVIALISGLAQYQVQTLRRRFLR